MRGNFGGGSRRSRGRTLVLKVTDIIPDNSLSPARSQEAGEGLPPPAQPLQALPFRSLPIMSYRRVFLSPCLPWVSIPQGPPCFPTEGRSLMSQHGERASGEVMGTLSPGPYS